MPPPDYLKARNDFEKARRRAALQQIASRLTGRSIDQLPFDELRAQLGTGGGSNLGLQDIPLDAIIGSVGRHDEYTRSFLPKVERDQERWARVKTFVTEKGFPPIEVYKLGAAYFVIDGNHRVSVARQMGMEFIQAIVTEIKVRLPVSPEDTPEEILQKACYASFLEQTDLDHIRPGADLRLSECEAYDILLSQIEVHSYILWQEQGRDVPYSEVVADWYDHVYFPIIELVRQDGLQRDFPGNSEADIYLMVIKHRLQLGKELGWDIAPPHVTTNLARQKSPRTWQVIRRMSAQMVDMVVPDSLQSGPTPGIWRSDRVNKRVGKGLFPEILVAGRGIPADYGMLAHAILVAQREQGRLMGLRVVPQFSEIEGETVNKQRTAFDLLCRDAGVEHAFSVDVGSVAERIIERAAWTDLVVLSLIRQSGPETAMGFGSGFDVIVQRSPRPILVIPEGAFSGMDRALVAYDGSPKSDEALYLAAYLAGDWSISLIVLSAGARQAGERNLQRARSYLERHQIQAEYVYRQGDPARMILDVAGSRGCNLFLMGGFGSRPVYQMILGSTVHAVLQSADVPVLICR